MDVHEFSEEYIGILEEHFPLEKEELGHNDQIDRVGLRHSLHSLFERKKHHVIADLQKKNRNRTAFHFGPSESITETLRCAPLYTDHVVTQDLLYRQIQFGPDIGGKLLDKRLFETAKEVINWKDFIKRGDVSIVPHPIFWDDEFRDEYVQLDGAERLYAPPLYAEGKVGITPMTDSKEITLQFYKAAGGQLGESIKDLVSKGRFDNEFLVDKLDGYADEIHTNPEVIDLLPRLLGMRDERNGAGNPELPDMFKLTDLDPDELERKRDSIQGFREEIYNAVEEVQITSERDEVDEIIESLGTVVQETYEDAVREVRGKQVREIKQGLLRSTGHAAAAGTVPLILGLTSGELYSILTLPQLVLTSGVAGATRFTESLLDANSASEENPVFTVFNSFGRANSSLENLFGFGEFGSESI